MDKQALLLEALERHSILINGMNKERALIAHLPEQAVEAAAPFKIDYVHIQLSGIDSDGTIYIAAENRRQALALMTVLTPTELILQPKWIEGFRPARVVAAEKIDAGHFQKVMPAYFQVFNDTTRSKQHRFVWFTLVEEGDGGEPHLVRVVCKLKTDAARFVELASYYELYGFPQGKEYGGGKVLSVYWTPDVAKEWGKLMLVEADGTYKKGDHQ